MLSSAVLHRVVPLHSPSRLLFCSSYSTRQSAVCYYFSSLIMMSVFTRPSVIRMSITRNPRSSSLSFSSFRTSRELSLPLSNTILKSFNLDGDLRPFTPRPRHNSSSMEEKSVTGDGGNSPDPHSDSDPDTNPIGKPAESVGVTALEDVQVILALMRTLHLLAMKSWCHLGILPNRLRMNRRISR